MITYNKIKDRLLQWWHFFWMSYHRSICYDIMHDTGKTHGTLYGVNYTYTKSNRRYHDSKAFLIEKGLYIEAKSLMGRPLNETTKGNRIS